MSRFDFIQTSLSDLMLVQRKAAEDYRGFLSRFYCIEAFAEAGIKKPIVQINQTLTRKKGAVRGLHFQHPPHAEIKLVSCLKGEVLDVVVDIRIGSPTFGQSLWRKSMTASLQWHGEILSAANRISLLIPEGYAHGFQALTEDCELIYLHTSAYHPDAEGALNVTDPALSIDWPLPVIDLSKRDQNHPFVTNINFKGITL